MMKVSASALLISQTHKPSPTNVYLCPHSVLAFLQEQTKTFLPVHKHTAKTNRSLVPTLPLLTGDSTSSHAHLPLRHSPMGRVGVEGTISSRYTILPNWREITVSGATQRNARRKTNGWDSTKLKRHKSRGV